MSALTGTSSMLRCPAKQNARQMCNVAPVFQAPKHIARPRLLPANAVATETIVEQVQQALPAVTKVNNISNMPHDEKDLRSRHRQVLAHFPTALGIDDFIARVEVVLGGYGFTGENSIAMTNLCRDEVTAVMKDKIESVFGSSFNTNGLGAVLTCGVTGMGAGLSHSPVCVAGRERYVFFSFPHIAIDGQGAVGSISRPGRAGRSCACGALQKCLNEFKAEGYECNCQQPGGHDPLDPEYSILKQRLARRMRYEKTDINDLSLTTITDIAERTITNDLEYLISKAIDTSKADYAVVTGVQIHNWATELKQGGAPSLEFAAPTKCYAVVNGEKMHLDLSKVPALSPRQLRTLASGNSGESVKTAQGTGSTLQEIPFSYLSKRLGGASVSTPQMNTPDLGAYGSEKKGPYNQWPSWQSIIRTKAGANRDAAAPNMESAEMHAVIDMTDSSARQPVLGAAGPQVSHNISEADEMEHLEQLWIASSKY